MPITTRSCNRKCWRRVAWLPPDRGEERDRLIRRIVNMGEGGCIISPFYCDYGYHIHIGKNFFANTNLVILDGADVSIGDNVFIAPNVGIYTAGHPLDVEQRNAGLEYAYPIRIGNNVWIGGNVVILPGVSMRRCRDRSRQCGDKGYPGSYGGGGESVQGDEENEE